MAARWPHVRAALIAAACVIGMVDGCPMGGPKEMEGHPGEALANAVRPLRDGFMTPFAPLGRLVRVGQRWALMQAASPERYRFTVEGQATPGGAWEVLYRAGDPEAPTTYTQMLEHTRVAGVFALRGGEPSFMYPRFITWFLARIFAERPDLASVRAYHEHVHLDAGVATPTGEQILRMTKVRPR